MLTPTMHTLTFGTWVAATLEDGCARVVGGITEKEWPIVVQEWVEGSESGVPNIEPQYLPTPVWDACDTVKKESRLPSPNHLIIYPFAWVRYIQWVSHGHIPD